MDKINLHYKIEGGGETLVFIHGLSDSLLYWEFLAANLKRDYQVLRVDLRGHGESELGRDEISMDTYVNDLHNLLNDLNVSKANLIGFSLGGAIALDFTVKHPQMVSSLVLMSSFCKADNHIGHIFDQFKNALDSSFEDFYDLILPMVLCPDVIDANREELKILKEITSQNANTEAYIKAIEACRGFNLENELSEIKIPSLVIAGRYDEITPEDSQKAMQSQLGDCKLVVLDGVKHNLLVGENSWKILDILKKFLKNK